MRATRHMAAGCKLRAYMEVQSSGRGARQLLLAVGQVPWPKGSHRGETALRLPMQRGSCRSAHLWPAQRLAEDVQENAGRLCSCPVQGTLGAGFVLICYCLQKLCYDWEKDGAIRFPCDVDHCLESEAVESS